MSADKSPANRKSHWLSILLKVLIVGALLWILARKGLLSVTETKKALSQLDIVVPAFGVIALNSLCGVIRWMWLLRAQDMKLPWPKVFQLVFIGNFFNIALPGAVSGDLIKAYYVGAEFPGKRGHAFGTILFDRLVGLCALVLVSTGSLIVGWSHFIGTPLFGAIRIVALISFMTVVFLVAYLFLVGGERDPLLKILTRLSNVKPQFLGVLKIYEGVRHYHSHRLVVLRVLALSVLIHITVGWACMQFGHALGDDHLVLLPILVTVPLGLLITAVPVLPAGVGTGHAAFSFLFQLMGSQRGADVFSLLALCNLVLGGIGGMIYLQYRSKSPTPDLTQAAG